MNIFNDVALALNEFGLSAAEKNLRTAEQNLANAHTPGYKKEIASSAVYLNGDVLGLESFDGIFKGTVKGKLHSESKKIRVTATKEQKDENNVDETVESINAEKALTEIKVAAMLANARFGVLETAIGK